MKDDVIAVDDCPLAPDQVLAGIDLFSSDQALSPGTGGHGVREGGVTFGVPTVYTIRPQDFPGMERRPDVDQWNYVLVHFRFDLEALPRGRRYVSAQFKVAFDHPQSVALALYPELITTAVDVERSRTFTLGPTLAFAGLGELSLGEASFGRRFRFTQLHPVITSFGGGKRAFSWTFAAQQNAELVACARATFAVVQLPKDVGEFRTTFASEVEVSRRVLGVFEPVAASGSTEPFLFRPAAGSFTPARQ
ncbi:hypothetical protein [Streptomyces sp. S.PB5]|uniref:hypothetical protein n=1 Tax=Streptomyces sp. S.PB5 TaxID=3020844 RepID=UPI0025AF46EB|nr:hypothetical protein [Streptomyces sp. S.PB5]MDN3028253.1 hypothetical protein [Streptomyces sp. S.PB5]